MKGILFAALISFASTAWSAAGGGSHDGIPSVVWYQLLNFSIALIVLAALLRKRLASYFEAKKDDYLEAVKRVETAKADAARRQADVKERLSDLEGTSAESLERAKREAGELQQKIIQEAEAMAKNLREEARRTAEAESRRAVDTLRREVLQFSIQSARKNLQGQMKEQDQQRLQKEFVEKIQVVAP